MRAESDRVAARVRELLGAEHDADPGVDDLLGIPHSGSGRDTSRATHGRREAGSPPRPRGSLDHSGPPGYGAPTLWQRLAARLPVRLDPGRRTAVVVGAVVLVVAVATGAWLLADRPQAMTVRSAAAGARLSSGAVPGSALGSAVRDPTSSGAPSSGAMPAGSTPLDSAGTGPPTSGASPSGTVVVDVAGKVRRPGVYELPAGSRVDDAIRMAGGALPGVAVNSLNLAARVVDGQQIPVGVAAAPNAGQPLSGDGAGDGSAADGAGGTGGTSAATPAAPVNLNTATIDQLQTLPGVGPVLSQHILDWRSAHGSFTSVSQLDDVSGIGTVKFAALRPLVTV